MRNVFRADLRDMQFVLWEQIEVQRRIIPALNFPDFDRGLVDDIINSAQDFAYQELGSLYQSSDREGCKLGPDGCVRLPSGYPAAWTAFRNVGWGQIGLPVDVGGIGLPYVATMPVQEMFCGANPGFMTLSGFCAPLFYLLRKFGSESLQNLFANNVVTNRWTACLCMTEPGAGTDIGSIASRAMARDDGTYAIRGAKIFISAGSHELAENIVYVVLARAGGSPSGTLGLSCFLVPRYRVGAADDNAVDNHVRCVRLEEKMGLHGCPTAQLSFGEDGECIGYLLGEHLNQGVHQLRLMMDQARIATGIYALGLASSAYQNSVEYALQRIQGCDYRQVFNPMAPRLAIIAHADVRRMLLEMKCKVEGCRALIYRLAFHGTRSQLLEEGRLSDLPSRESDEGLVSLLTPIAKAYTSDQAWRIAELAIQVHGGYGYTRDFPVEQYARDAKILSIWEGTNYVQAVDLIRDKLGMGCSPKLLKIYIAEIKAFLTDSATPRDRYRDKLSEALSCLESVVNEIGRLVRAKKMELVLVHATRFLSIMAHITMAWLLLEAAVISQRALAQVDERHPDASFYRGKVLSAQFFFGQFLTSVFQDTACILEGEDSVLRADVDVFCASGKMGYWKAEV